MKKLYIIMNKKGNIGYMAKEIKKETPKTLIFAEFDCFVGERILKSNLDKVIMSGMFSAEYVILTLKKENVKQHKKELYNKYKGVYLSKIDYYTKLKNRLFINENAEVL